MGVVVRLIKIIGEMALCAATTIPTKDECIESLQQIIDFTIAKERSFESWFEILKTAIFPILYRDVCKELGIVEGNPGTSRSCCQHPSPLWLRVLSA